MKSNPFPTNHVPGQSKVRSMYYALWYAYKSIDMTNAPPRESY